MASLLEKVVSASMEWGEDCGGQGFSESSPNPQRDLLRNTGSSKLWIQGLLNRAEGWALEPGSCQDRHGYCPCGWRWDEGAWADVQGFLWALGSLSSRVSSVAPAGGRGAKDWGDWKWGAGRCRNRGPSSTGSALGDEPQTCGQAWILHMILALLCGPK